MQRANDRGFDLSPSLRLSGGINRADDYHKIKLTSSKREQQEESPVLNLSSFLPSAEIEKLTNKFKQDHHLRELAQA